MAFGCKKPVTWYQVHGYREVAMNTTCGTYQTDVPDKATKGKGCVMTVRAELGNNIRRAGKHTQAIDALMAYIQVAWVSITCATSAKAGGENPLFIMPPAVLQYRQGQAYGPIWRWHKCQILPRFKSKSWRLH